MNDPRRPERFGSPLTGAGSIEPRSYETSPYVDPAYADQAPYAPTYVGPVAQWSRGSYEPNPTLQLPPYWQQDQFPPGQGLQETPAVATPGGPKSRRWLWLLAAAAVLVIALVIALAIANGPMKEQTAVEPLPPMPTTSSTIPTRTTWSTPSAIPAPVPPTSEWPVPTTPTATPPGAMQSVVYNVNGDGRAISIMYIDTGDIIQTEFNVPLPWSKQVSLSKSAVHPASVTIINIGHNVTCSLTVGGVQVRQRVGVGLTICDAPRN